MLNARDLAHVTLACDLDGTLVDTAPDLHRALLALLEEVGLPAQPYDQTRRFVGQGSRALIERSTRVAGAQLDAGDLKRLTNRFVEIYASGIADLSRVFDGVSDALEDLDARGVRLVVCTNKRTDLSERLLETIGLAPRFLAVIGADRAPAQKPDPSHLLAAVRAGGGDPRFAMIVGDSSADVNAARAAGLPAIAVTFGYPDAPVETLGADALLDHWRDAPSLVARLARSA
ncbi:phosphoglycolate phosphatase [bacterium]|nr:phosphoglycolate phosphatase [bacterium]